MSTRTNLDLGTKKAVPIKMLAGITIFILLAGIGSNITPNLAMGKEDDNSTNSTIPTLPAVLDNETALGQEISDFVHHAIQIFKEQRNTTLAAIRECHANLANVTAADRDQIMNKCKSNLNAIRDKYADERAKYHELFAQFRDHMRVFLKEARGLSINANEKKQALDNIMSVRHKMMLKGEQDILHGMSDIMKDHGVTNSTHLMIGTKR